MISEQDIKKALSDVFNQYGEDIALTVEAIYRNETKHFKSGNFQITLGAGMEDSSKNDAFPYGWASLKDFWLNNPDFAPIGIHKQVENDSGLAKSKGSKDFLKFKTITAGMFAVAEIMKKRGNISGKWFSTEPKKIKAYSDYIAKIRTPFVNSIINEKLA